MKVLNWHIPGTRDYDQEITKLQVQLRSKEAALQDLREQDERLAAIVRQQSDRAELFKNQAEGLRKEMEAYRLALGVTAAGHDLLPEQMLEIAKQAKKIERDANRSCSLSYELFAVQVCEAADRLLPKLDEQQAKFLIACLGDNYTPPHERGKDWQSEHEIRQDLCRQLYGEPQDHA
jgi:hypothetical protein